MMTNRNKRTNIKRTVQKQKKQKTGRNPERNEMAHYLEIFLKNNHKDGLLYRRMNLYFCFHEYLEDLELERCRWRLLIQFVCTDHPSVLLTFCEVLISSSFFLVDRPTDNWLPRLYSPTSSYPLWYFFTSADLAEVRVIKTNIIEATSFPEDEELKKLFLKQLVDLHSLVPTREEVINKSDTSLIPVHILTSIVNLLNLKGINVRGLHGNFHKLNPDYSIVDSNGHHCMLFDFKEFPVLRWSSSTIRGKKVALKGVIRQLVFKMIKLKCSFGALTDWSDAIMIELDLGRLAFKQDQNDNNFLRRFPLNICITGEEDQDPSYVQVLLAWILRAAKEGPVRRYEMERLQLQEVYGLNDSQTCSTKDFKRFCRQSKLSTNKPKDASP